MAATTSVGSSMVSTSTSFPQVPFSFLPKSYKEVNIKWTLQMRPFVHVLWPIFASYTTEESCKPWLEFLHHMHLFIREESNLRYDETVITIAQTYDIDTACVHTAEDLFKKMRKDSNLNDEMKFLHHAISIFKGPLKHTKCIHDIRMNVQEKFKIRIVQMSDSPHHCTCHFCGAKTERNGMMP